MNKKIFLAKKFFLYKNGDVHFRTHGNYAVKSYKKRIYNKLF